MASLVAELSFVQVGDPSVTYDFFDGQNDVQIWTPSMASRGQSRAQMQMHGDHPRNPLFGGLTIDHEGIFIADTQEDVVAERDLLLAALLGDLTEPPASEVLGTLTVKYLGWTESASQDVTVDTITAGFTGTDLLTLSYQIQWRTTKPYFIGDMSNNPVYV